MNILRTKSGKALTAAFLAVAVSAVAPSAGFAKELVPNETLRGKAQAKGVDGNLLEDFPFLEHARNNSGSSCCGMKDGVKIDAADIQETDDPANPYRVLLRRTSSGLTLAQPFWINIPAEKVLSGERINSICEAYDEAVEAHNAKKPGEEIDLVCTPPSFSVAFINDGSWYNATTGQHHVSGKPYDSGTVITQEQYGKTDSNLTKYCFYNAQPAF